MYVKVRSMDGTKTVVLTISKLTSVVDVRSLIEDKFEVPPERQRLFYRGKQMEDGHNLFDYNVNINDVIQLMIKPVLTELTNGGSSKELKANKRVSINKKVEKKPEVPLESAYYKVGDLVDAKCLCDGTWWEGKIVKIAPNANCVSKSDTDDGLIYYIKFERYADLPEDEVTLEHVRPRARTKIPLKTLKPGCVVMVNYNFENPEERGFWYDCKITKVIDNSSEKDVVGTLFIGGKKSIEDCHIRLKNEIFEIEKNILLTDRTEEADKSLPKSPVERKSGPTCSTCKDNKKRKCKDCGCSKCGGKESPDKQLMCDECDQPYHIFCLDPPLQEIPDVDEWFCPMCKNDDTEIVKAGEKLKESKKKSKMASAKNNTGRDWGKGFACAGRQKVCTLVPPHHFGPIPGVEVGSLWKFRLQVSEAGIHRPHVAGIHGREHDGAYSIVLAGGYEDDEDRGDEFTYTGSGGRDLSGNKRTAEQSCDQTLTRMNRALALNCNIPVNKNGAEAQNWKGGKPVRVVRSSKGRKHSDYAPEEGNRYDGIYKIVKYWQAAGKSGFKVWRYLLRRDDSNPAPWTKEGEKKIKQLGLTLQYPEGYLEAMEEKEKAKNLTSSSDEEEPPKKRGRKRKSTADENDEPTPTPNDKMSKSSEKYKLEKDLLEHVNKDKLNGKDWQCCKDVAVEGKVKFLKVVEERFLCVCCQILVHKPVTTPCAHNVCQSCLQQSFKAEVFTCPSCRHDLGKTYTAKVNEHLRASLIYLFPGYEAGR